MAILREALAEVLPLFMVVIVDMVMALDMVDRCIAMAAMDSILMVILGFMVAALFPMEMVMHMEETVISTATVAMMVGKELRRTMVLQLEGTILTGNEFCYQDRVGRPYNAPKGMAATAVAPSRFDADIIHSDEKLGNKRYICYCI